MIMLREWREARGLSQQELAERVGVSQVHISRIERGADTTTKVVNSLARALQTTPQSLYTAPPVAVAA